MCPDVPVDSSVSHFSRVSFGPGNVYLKLSVLGELRCLSLLFYKEWGTESHCFSILASNRLELQAASQNK